MTKQEGCFRAYMKPGQSLPEFPKMEELYDGMRAGRIVVIGAGGKRIEPPPLNDTKPSP